MSRFHESKAVVQIKKDEEDTRIYYLLLCY